jgi:hypothetical protein
MQVLLYARMRFDAGSISVTARLLKQGALQGAAVTATISLSTITEFASCQLGCVGSSNSTAFGPYKLYVGSVTVTTDGVTAALTGSIIQPPPDVATVPELLAPLQLTASYGCLTGSDQVDAGACLAVGAGRACVSSFCPLVTNAPWVNLAGDEGSCSGGPPERYVLPLGNAAEATSLAPGGWLDLTFFARQRLTPGSARVSLSITRSCDSAELVVPWTDDITLSAAAPPSPGDAVCTLPGYQNQVGRGFVEYKVNGNLEITAIIF